MWWFTRKEDRSPVSRASSPRQQAEDELLAAVPDMSFIIKGQDVALKIWLPESVADTVKWLSGMDGESQSAWLREQLVAYVYGRLALRALRIRAQQVESEAPRFSRKAVDRTRGRWIYKVPQLGKNIVAVKLWLSQALRDDLQALADHARTPLSAFVREAIIADLLGRASLPERPQIMGRATPEAQAWERDEEVPVLELEADQFNGLGEREEVWLEDGAPG